MSNEEKFAGFKQKLIEDNERQYGQEVREKYGEAALEASNRKLKNMTEAQYADIQQIENDMFTSLEQAMDEGDAACQAAQRAADLHRRWLTFYWDSYTREAHAGVAQMYVDDERFTAYYDKRRPGLAEFLRDAVRVYTGIKD